MQSVRSSVVAGPVVLLVAGFAACDGGGGGTGGAGGDSAACPVSGAGTLVVNVEGLPAGVPGKVTVTGPGGPVGESVGETHSYDGLAAGSYHASADRVTRPDPIVRTVYSPSISEDTVCVGDAATRTITVSYAAIPTSNKLWLSNSNSPNNTGIEGFASADLGASGSPGATVAATSLGAGHVLFDKDGNLWAGDGTRLFRYLASTLDSSGVKTADLEINITGLDCLPATAGMAFDASGNLWVASPCLAQVMRLTGAQLAASGEVAPDVSLSVAKGAQGVAFDSGGNLWVSTPDDGHLLRFDAPSIVAGDATPSLTLSMKTRSDDTGAPLKPSWLAFDGAGALWSDDFGGNILFLIPASDLGATGVREVVPPVQATISVSALLEGMAFDESGGLWLSYSAGKFIRLSPAQLTVSTDAGDPTTPERIVASPDVGYVDNVAFYPAPASLPLYSALP